MPRFSSKNFRMIELELKEEWRFEEICNFYNISAISGILNRNLNFWLYYSMAVYT